MKIGVAFCFAALVACSSSEDGTGAGADAGSGQGANSNVGGSGGSAANDFWLEPRKQTLIGTGQLFIAYAALQGTTEPYPTYVDPKQITWNAANSAISVNAEGRVLGLSEGTSKLTASYQGRSAELEVVVAGTLVERSVAVPGQGMRTYSIYSPDGAAKSPRPVLLAFHGGGGSAMLNAASTLLNARAHADNFYVVYPNGTGAIQTFNAGACCGSAQMNDVDDLAYFDAMLEDLEANFTIDAQKVYSTGFSNGGMISHRLACERSDRVAGIAAVSGASGQFDRSLTEYYPCNPARPIPILHIHYANDRNYPLEGGKGEGLSSTDFYPVEATIADWRARNNVTSADDLEEPTPTTKCHRYRTPAVESSPSAPVTLCVLSPPDVFDAANEIVFGGGHAWPGGVRSPSPTSDTPSLDFDANSYLWAFLNP